MHFISRIYPVDNAHYDTALARHPSRVTAILADRHEASQRVVGAHSAERAAVTIAEAAAGRDEVDKADCW
jgi:hypothetical protein